MGRSKLSWFVLVVLFITISWLNPFAPGPSPAVVPWLLALAATACLVLLGSLRWTLGEAAAGWSFSQRWAAPMAWALVIAGVLSSAIGLLQYFGAAAAFDPWINQSKLGEAFANLRQRNQFASLTNIALAALIWLATSLRPVQRLDACQAMLLLATAVLAIGNSASSSRTGLVQIVLLCALCFIWGLWRQRLIRRVLLSAVLAYALATVVLPWLAGFDLSLHGMAARLRTGDEACASRITLWSNVLHLIAQKPWLGWGWGELDNAHYMTLYAGPRFCDILDNAHNLPLQLAVELGVPAALLICGGFAYWVLRQRPWREVEPTRQMAWSVIAVILLHSMLEYPLWYGPFQMAFGLCLFMLWQTRKQPMVPKVSKYLSNSLLAKVLTTQAAIFIIAVVAYAAWDYHRISQIYLPPASRDATYRDDTLTKIRSSWLFRDQVRFAELLLTPLTQANAEWTFTTATALLHYSPEPRIIEKVIESAVMLGRDDEALAHIARYQAAFAQDHALWALTASRNPLN